ncbi:AMP-binding protein [bacterium]|nr:AMP-binding protein [bacterium]
MMRRVGEKDKKDTCTIRSGDRIYVLPTYTKDYIDSLDPESADILASFLEEWFGSADFVRQKTSGSTGAPKALRLSKAAMRAHAQRTNTFFGIGSTHRLCTPLPVSSIAWKMTLVRAQIAGAEVLHLEPSNARWLERLDQADFFSLVPAQLGALLETGHIPVGKVFLIGGAAVSLDQLQRLSALDPPSEFWQSYGMSESLSHIALRRLHPQLQPGFAPLSGVELFEGSEGALAFVDQVTGIEGTTTDRVAWLESGHFIWVGRLDAALISGGYKILPEPLERFWSERLGTRVLLGALPDPDWGDVLCLAIEGSFDVQRWAQVLEHSLKLPKQERPRAAVFLEMLPEHSAGKWNREGLRRMLQQQSFAVYRL